MFKNHIEKSNITLEKAVKSGLKLVSPKRSLRNDSTSHITDDIIHTFAKRKSLARNDQALFKVPSSKRSNVQKFADDISDLYGQRVEDARVVLEDYKSLDTFPCTKCNRIFVTSKSYLKHNFACVHSCKICKIDFKSELNFKVHYTKRHNLDLMNDDSATESENESKGKGATTATYSKDEFVKKFIKHHPDGFRCKVCLVNIDKGYLGTHLSSHHLSSRPYKCSFCPDRFFNCSVRTNHMARVHPEEYKCELCDTQFCKHTHLENHCSSLHLTVTGVVKSTLEDVDPKPETFLYVERQSIELKTPNSRRKAPIKPMKHRPMVMDRKMKSEPKEVDDQNFEQSFSVADFLETEMVAYDAPVDVTNDNNDNDDCELEEIEATYTYDEFIEKFVTKKSDSQLMCNPCGNNIILKSSFKTHIRNCHAVKPTYLCELCPRSFMKYEQRHRHMKESHINDFRCELCDKQYFHSKTFKEHMLYIHSEAVDIKTLKTIDELDLPLDQTRFREKIDKSVRSNLIYSHVKRKLIFYLCFQYARNGRKAPAASVPRKPVAAEQFTLERFKKNFIITTKSGHLQCSICSLRIFQKTLMPHILEQHVLTKFTFCELCDEPFQSDAQRKAHMEESHPGKQKCVLCEVQFTKETSYLNHMKTMHSLSLAVSERMKIADIPLDELLFTDEHPNLKKLSTFCFEHVPDDIEMTRDQFYTKYIRLRKDDPSRGHCLACGVSFRDANRRLHIDCYHAPLKQFACDFCPMRFNLKFKIKKHMMVRHPNDYKCTKCDVQFTKYQQYVDHMKDEHKIKPVIEKLQDNDITADDLLYVRILDKNLPEDDDKTQNGYQDDEITAEIFNCQYCNQEFDSERMHRNHLRLDCKSNPNNVDDSSDEAESEQNEIVAEDPHPQPQQEFPCEECGKVFPTAKRLMGHTGWHKRMNNNGAVKLKKGETIYECDICNMIVPALHAYRHLRTYHKKEYRCNICKGLSVSFLRSKSHLLKNHPRKVKLAMSQRHKCTHCFRSFITIENLNDHVKFKHEGEGDKVEKPFFCEPCMTIFQKEHQLEEHKKNSHHIYYQVLFDKEIERELNQSPEEYDEKQDSDYDNDNDKDDEDESDTFQPDLNSTKRKRGPSINSCISSTSSMTSGLDNAKGNDEHQSLPPPIKKEKFDFDSEKTVYDNAWSFMRSYDDLFECSLCEVKENSRDLMLHHLKEHDEVPKLTCEYCSEVFLFKLGYEAHMKYQHNYNSEEATTQSSNRCEICNLDFKLGIQKRRHDAREHPEKN